MKKRFLPIYLPFLLVKILTTAVCTHFRNHWTPLSADLDFSETQQSLWMSLIISGLVAWAYLAVRLGMRYPFMHGRYAWTSGLFLAGWLSLFAMLVGTRSYLVAASSKIQELSSLRQLETIKPCRFYKLQRHFVDARNMAASLSTESSRRSLNYRAVIHLVVPVFDNGDDTTLVNPYAWIGAQYTSDVEFQGDRGGPGLDMFISD
jgi:hypothetical protein